jgi:tetratricopeptide (TPR) repeat protein
MPEAGGPDGPLIWPVATSHRNRAWAAASVPWEEPADAEAVYRQALGLKPDFREAHNNLGLVLAAQGKRPAAAAAFQAAIRLKPDDPLAHNNLGNVLADDGKMAEALASFERAIRHKPDLREAHYNLGRILHRLKRPLPIRN